MIVGWLENVNDGILLGFIVGCCEKGEFVFGCFVGKLVIIGCCDGVVVIILGS